MSEPVATAPAGAGALLRAAREDRQISIEHLAGLLKVPEAKLIALEEDRFDALPGRAFVRSLAMSVCRQLETDPQPVLDALPRVEEAVQDLEHVNRGLATPFGRSSAGLLPGLPMSVPDWVRPGVMVPVALLLLATGFWFSPALNTWRGGAVPGGTAAASAAEFSVSTVGLASGALAASSAAAGVGAVGASTAGGTLATAPNAGSQPAVVGSGSSITVNVPLAGASAGGMATPAGNGPLVLRAVQSSWVEVRDAKGVLVSRTLALGEVLPLDGVPPFKLKIGNASGVQASYRGQAVDLVATTKDNVARLELP